MRTTASLNSRAAVFQESLALPFKRNVLNEMLEFVTLTSRFSGHSFKLEGSPGFYPPYFPEKFSKFRPENTLVFCVQQEVFGFLFFLILFSAGIYLQKDWLKRSQNGTTRNSKLFLRYENSYK